MTLFYYAVSLIFASVVGALLLKVNKTLAKVVFWVLAIFFSLMYLAHKFS